MDQQLPKFPQDVRISLRFALLANVEMNGVFRITTEDIWAECIKIQPQTPELLEPLRKWTEDQLAIPIPNEAFQQFIENVSKQDTQSTLSALKGSIIAAKNETVATALDQQRLQGTSSLRSMRFPTVRSFRWNPWLLCVLILVVFAISPLYIFIQDRVNLMRSSESEMKTARFVEQFQPFVQPGLFTSITPDLGIQNELPANMQYHTINEQALKDYLHSRNSLLTDEPYFDAIIETARDFNIHPLLMFAITGQEQGFVPRDRENAKEIANNPFNVYHSWREYNTTIEDSARIAAKTITNLIQDRPEHIHPLQWINRKYAEDPNWWIGVEKLFQTLLGLQSQK